MHPDFIGSIAAILTTVAFVPQAWKALKTKDTHGISLSMYVIFSIGVACWLVYGLLLESYPIIGANIVTLALALLILRQTWKNRG